MKSCLRWADAINDCAAGKTPDSEFAAHLVICPECRNALEGRRAVAARMDEAIRRSGAVDPPLFGPERVMARVQRQPETRAWRRWASLRSAMPAASIGMLIAISSAILMWVPRPAPGPHVTALSTWRSPTEALLLPPVAAAWSIRPRLGEAFVKIKPSGEKHAK